MMLIMYVVCVLKTLNRYIRLAESLCSANYVQTYVFQILEENLHDMAHFRRYRLFPGWFQVMPFISWIAPERFQVILDGFRSLQVLPRFSKYIDVLIKKV